MQKSCRRLRIHSLSRYPRIWYSCESGCLQMWRCQAQPRFLQMDDHVLVFRMAQSTAILTLSWKVVQVSSSNFRCLRRALNIARCTLSRSSPSPGSQGHRDKRKNNVNQAFSKTRNRWRLSSDGTAMASLYFFFPPHTYGYLVGICWSQSVFNIELSVFD